MPVNPPQRDKTLQEVIDWCTARANELIEDTNGDYYAQFCQVDALTWVINHCREMLGYSDSMPLEAPNQSEDAQHDRDGR